MNIQSTPTLATPMCAPARVHYRAVGMSTYLALTAEDIAALDPSDTGTVDLFGVLFTRDTVNVHAIDAACAALTPAHVWEV